MKKYIIKNQGFTLMEMTLVLVIVGLILGFSFGIATKFKKLNREKEAIERAELVKNALISYAKLRGHLPYADSDGDGDSDNGVFTGTVPYKDLNLSRSDVKGLYSELISYDINNDLANLSTLSSEDATRQSICNIYEAKFYPPPASLPAGAQLAAGTFTEYPKINYQSENTEVAFVLFLPGVDKTLSTENSDSDRIYEPANSNSDDIVIWETYSNLYEDIGCNRASYLILNQTGNNLSILDDEGCKTFYNLQQTILKRNAVFYSTTNCSGAGTPYRFYFAQKADMEGDRDTKVTLTNVGIIDR